MSIKNNKNWLVWETKDRPTSALTGQQSGWNRSLCTYAEAAQFVQDNPTFNIGLCFSKDLDYIGLDLDSCIGENGVEQWAKDIVLSLNDSIVIDNKSVSGTGLKMVLKCSEQVKRGVRFLAEAPKHGDHVPQVELFTDNKYFALTEGFEIDDEAGEVNLDALSEVMGFDVTEVAATKAVDSVSGSISKEELAQLLSKLDINDFSHRDDWIKMLQAAHHGTAGDGLEEFRAWSAQDEEQFNDSDLQRDWDSQRVDVVGGVTIGTLIARIPKEDRPQVEPEADFEIVPIARTESPTILGWLVNETERNHAKVVEQMSLDSIGNSMRYVTDWDCWIFYDGGVWKRDLRGARMHQIVTRYLKALSGRIPGSDAEQAAKASGWVSSLQNNNGTMGVVRQARGEGAFMISLKQMESDNAVLNFENGTYDLDKDEFREHRPEDYCFYTCNTNYVVGQEAPLWDRVVSEIFAGNSDLAEYVRRIFGYAISGSVSDPIFSIFYGSGANGKSTIVQTISSLLGDYSTNLPSELFSKKDKLHPTYMASLHNARLAVVAELEADVTLAEATVKKVTSTDKIEARRMREDPWEFTPTHTSILCSNHLPLVKGNDLGIWRRIKTVPFNVNLSERKDVTIPKRLEAEYAGIACWLIQGYRDYKAQGGVGTCEAVEKATKEYRESEDWFRQGAEDLFVAKEGSAVSQSQAYAEYKRSGGTLGKRKFVKEMGRIGYESSRIYIDGVQVSGFAGITLLTLTRDF